MIQLRCEVFPKTYFFVCIPVNFCLLHFPCKTFACCVKEELVFIHVLCRVITFSKLAELLPYSYLLCLLPRHKTLDLSTERNDKDASKPVDRHFNLPNHSSQHMTICGLSLALHQGNTESHKNLEQNTNSLHVFCC